MESNLMPLKNIMYDILNAGDDGGDDVRANQQMAVQLSNTVRKEGTNIIQLQSVVSSKVINKVTEALKYIDALAARSLPEPQDVTEVTITESPNEVTELIYQCLDRKMSLVAFNKMMAERYCSEAVNSMGEQKAKQVLQIREPKLKKIIGG